MGRQEAPRGASLTRMVHTSAFGVADAFRHLVAGVFLPALRGTILGESLVCSSQR